MFDKPWPKLTREQERENLRKLHEEWRVRADKELAIRGILSKWRFRLDRGKKNKGLGGAHAFSITAGPFGVFGEASLDRIVDFVSRAEITIARGLEAAWTMGETYRWVNRDLQRHQERWQSRADEEKGVREALHEWRFRLMRCNTNKRLGEAHAFSISAGAFGDFGEYTLEQAAEFVGLTEIVIATALYEAWSGKPPSAKEAAGVL